MAFLEYLSSSGPAQITFLVANPNSVAAGQRRGHERLLGLPEEVGRDHRRRRSAIAQFLDRDTDPGFAKQMQSFLQTWLTNPDQDMTAYLKSIQDFWDSLGIS